MSDRSLRLIVSVQARKDYRDIFAYTLENWGKDQAIEYGDTLERGFLMVHSNPELGVVRHDLGTNIRSLVVEKHRIVYRVTQNTVRILRIVHERREPRQDLNN